MERSQGGLAKFAMLEIADIIANAGILYVTARRAEVFSALSVAGIYLWLA